MNILLLFFGVCIAYLIGSIPTAYLFGRIFKDIDIREYGSGNVGATNIFRVVGRLPGVIVLIIDILKGLLCTTWLATAFLNLAPFSRPELYKILCGSASIIGHNWTIFLRFRGGKGVATSAGVLIGLVPQIFWLSFVVWLIVFTITGYVSVSSIISAISAPIFSLVFGQPPELVIFLCITCILIVYKHRSNIKRLQLGEEKKISIFKRGH